MGQAITNAFITYLRDCKASQEPVVLDEVVLANIPNLDPDAPIDQNSGLPAASRIVHRQPVDQRGRINADAVTYSIVMDTTIGDFDFNAMYLINSALGIVGMIVHKGTERKVSSNIDTGKTGNSIVKSMVMSYRGAASATVTTVDASTWQIDYAARLRGMDDDMRLDALRAFGAASFLGDSFKLVNDGGTFNILPGVAHVGGLRVKLDEAKPIYPQTPWFDVWLDVHRAGSPLDAWVNYASIRVRQSVLLDYVDSHGYQHYVTRIGHVDEAGAITDRRTQRKLRLTGDVQGTATLDVEGDIIVTLQVADDSHEHTIATIRGLQPALDSKAQVGHTHSPNESGAAPAVHGHAVADIWGLQADLDSKSNVGHTHTPSESGAAPTVHGHAMADVAGLQTALSGKSNIGHTHSPSESGAAPAVHGHSVGDIWGLQEDLNGKADVSHAHSPGSIGAAPAEHSHTAARGNADVVAGGSGQIGTYGFFYTQALGAYGPGQTVPGSSLRWSSTDMHESDMGGGSPAGTWKLMGYYPGGAWTKSLWIRIA
ncbi:phage tail protein [Aeromonas veronii]|uniref:phage tail-collar fiber domain-containing protein n=1 Tax=Aeromonas TaxID=642 RepID=UPI0022EB6A5E|nr:MULTISPECIES: phage tail protein [Aeromonas]KAJ8740051.1 phage tail protein [Aeromonas veronii]MDA3317869.1 phage tail protein [Aeromonas sp. PI_26]